MELFLVFKLWTYAKLDCLNYNCLYEKNGFGINNLQWLMCHKIKPNPT